MGWCGAVEVTERNVECECEVKVNGSVSVTLRLGLP